MDRKYPIPELLSEAVDQKAYDKWLGRKAVAHRRRDRKRRNTSGATNEQYKIAIHNAVVNSAGRDAYADERLDWTLISKFRNEDARRGRRVHKAGFALLPTVDHVDDGLGEPDFKICAWRTNDAKNDLAEADFVALCRRVFEYHDRVHQARQSEGLSGLGLTTDHKMEILRGED